MSDRAENDLEASKPEDTTKTSDFFNYHPPFLLVILESAVWLCLCLVVFAAPNGGLSAVVKDDGGTYVGVLRKCSKTSCDGWMAGSSSGGAETTTAAEKRALYSRDISAIDLPSFYLRAGLGTLAAFWLMTYTLLFLLIRYVSSPPPWSAAEKTGKGIRDMVKRFSWRISRIFTFFLVFVLLGVACDATWKIKEAGVGGAGIGLGVLLLHLSWILLVFCTYMEISRGYIRRKADLTYWGCGFLQFCPTYKQRAVDKWHQVDNGSKSDDGEDGSGGGRRQGKGGGRTKGRKQTRKSKQPDDTFDDVAI